MNRFSSNSAVTVSLACATAFAIGIAVGNGAGGAQAVAKPVQTAQKIQIKPGTGKLLKPCTAGFLAAGSTAKNSTYTCRSQVLHCRFTTKHQPNTASAIYTGVRFKYDCVPKPEKPK